MDKFRTRKRYEILSAHGSERLLTIDLSSDEGEAVVAQLREALGENFVVQPCAPGFDAILERPEPEPFVPRKLPENPAGMADPILHWHRIQAIKESLAPLHVRGLSEFDGLPAGWMRVAEWAAEGFAEALSEHEGGRLGIRQIKEKFGELRFYISAEGPEAFVERVQNIALWAEAATIGRCMVTGLPGAVDHAVWRLTLCPEAMIWRRQFPEPFRAALFPREPGEGI